MKEDKKKKILLFVLIPVFVLMVTFLIIFLIKPANCDDGTSLNSCSNVRPYYCSNGKLIENASKCGCPQSSNEEGNLCISDYKTEPKQMAFKYVLKGKEGYVNITVYGGVYEYLSNLPRYADSEENFTLADFKLNMINEEIQKGFLFQLFLKIANITSDKEDRVRIAISLVQNIPFGSSDKVLRLGKIPITYQRYPYEVLYDNEGICSEKSELLFFLLKQMGYGTASLYYVKENHEVVGIKCPVGKSVLNSGYCFVETTGPSILGDDQTDYFGESRTLNSTPRLIPISDGNSLGINMIEYRDSKVLISIRNKAKKYGELNFYESTQWNILKERYGLISFGQYEFN
jgi:hypothetical protein